MSSIEDFLTADEEQEIIDAIRQAEQNTSGEIRVHLERHATQNPFERATEVFHYLKMDNTRLQNGVLIYVAIDDRTFIIYGDKGINDVVPKDFWNCTKDVMLDHFKSGSFKRGIIEGVLKAGEQLEAHFPWDHGDLNELPDTVSKG